MNDEIERLQQLAEQLKQHCHDYSSSESNSDNGNSRNESGSDNEDAHADGLGKSILITGASSGIGLYAAKLLATMNPWNRLILVTRDHGKAEYARQQVLSVLCDDVHDDEERNRRLGKYGKNVISLCCDHSDLNSVRAFHFDLREALRSTHTVEKWGPHNGLDCVCLNAAILMGSGGGGGNGNDGDGDGTGVIPQYTVDDMEVTFQTNHLSPFLLMHTIQDLINPNGRVIITTSGLHLRYKLSFDGVLADSSHKDDDAHHGARSWHRVDTGRKVRRVRRNFEMIDGSPYHYKNSYALSKLCNVAFCMELQDRLRKRDLKKRNIVVNCFSPGLITESGLFRRQAPRQQQTRDGQRQQMEQEQHDRKQQCPYGIHNEMVLRKEKTVAWGGGALAYMITADETASKGGMYWRDVDTTSMRPGTASRYGIEFCPTPVSEQVVPPDSRKTLWEVSCQLVGLPVEGIL